MPTGYTAKLMDKGQSFPEFVMLCARSFGALIEMRDEPMDAPIPDKFEPSNYHAKALDKAKAEFKRLSKMTPEQQFNYGSKLQREALAAWDKCAARNEAENARIDAMVEKVSAWMPPTKEHYRLKEFMLEQLSISRHDMEWASKHRHHTDNPPIAHYRKALDSAKRDIGHHAEEMVKEHDRAKQRTEWVQKLRESLKEAK
jgi:hypothetical protein